MSIAPRHPATPSTVRFRWAVSTFTRDEMHRPFRGTEATAGPALSLRELRRFYQPVYPGVYAPRGVELSVTQRARAAWLWSRRRGVVAGLSASAVLGAKWIEPGRCAELAHDNRRTPPMLTVHSDELSPAETTEDGGMTVTTPARTAFDLARRLDTKEAVLRIDAPMHATKLEAVEIDAVIDAHPGARGVSRLRKTLTLVDGGAESPYESLTRLTLVTAGLPAPQTQLPVLDEFGFVVAYLIWVGESFTWGLSTTALNTGPTRGSAVATSSGSPTWMHSAGRSFGSRLGSRFVAWGRCSVLICGFAS
jgi:hypothetical protein